ncbi:MULTISPECIES: hypothetical protein [unclassified Vibrio]|nr:MULTISPECIES: hypothetical protein [unclassified Vibrio]MDW2192763.1 hypothetical protein [Vibrio sp. 1641]MDW2275511.1 hypothetical protein [Vibrio sp. 1074]MDW2286776.1 hypothetical protein [Vibrio sp. 1562]MDW3122550.1 hypothetical protein [Vibrio sp. 1974]
MYIKEKHTSVTSLLVYKISYLIFLVIYTLATIYFSVQMDKSTSENSLIEMTQIAFVLFSSLMCLYKSKEYLELKHILVIISSFFMVIFVREMDYHIEQYFPHGSWKYPAWIIIVSVCYFCFNNIVNIKNEVKLFISHSSFTTLTIGFFIVFLFSRFAGYGDFWVEFMGNSYNRDVKNLVEESLELLGYAILLNGVLLIKVENH